MDSPTVSISTSSQPKARGGKDKASDKDADAFSISLDIAREEAGGDEAKATITIQGVKAEGGQVPDGPVEDEVTIEIETVVFSGDDLAQNLSASTVLGGGSVAQTKDGAFGVSGSISGDAELRLEVGETLSFALPATEGKVVGGQVTITNLFSDGDQREGALIFAYDADDIQLACYCAVGNETGSVTVDIDVPFARLDFKALDNDSFLFADNSNYAVSSVSAVIASVIDGLADGASQVIDGVVASAQTLLPELVDLGHFGTVNFEISRISVNEMASINGLSRVRVNLDTRTDQRNQGDFERDVVNRQKQGGHAAHWQAGDEVRG